MLLLADGALIADGPAREVLSGGSYFVTETARILGGAGAALTPEQGIAALTAVAERADGGGDGVSWQLAAFGILALALAGGFWWYERTRPDARIVALVGTLAAFAALGRIAFAAVPNVKPTSDIVLISGYALGGGPGFAVGAIAGLASNFFFGQGPWTPWQMAAWGVTGIVGAGLALVWRGRTIGRWPLAIACCVCGFAFTAVQDVGDWITYSDHSLAQLGVYVGQGLGFDAIYAGSCLVFALAFGPALLRSIQRFTKRLEITWLAPGSSVAPLLAVAVALAGTAAVAGGARAPTARAATDVLQRPVDYLLHAQNDDGGFGARPARRRARCSPAGRRSGCSPPACVCRASTAVRG